MADHMEQFRAARRSAAPIVIIRTADYSSVTKEITTYYTERQVPILNWDNSRGVMGVNQLGGEAATKVNANDQQQPAALVTGNPVEALQRILPGLPSKSILFMMNLQIILESKDPGRLGVIQGIWNCRDAFKTSQRTLVLLVPDIKVPPELSNDVIILDVSLPDRQGLSEIVLKQFVAAKLDAPAPDKVGDAVDAISGLSAFSAEQVTAMSLGRKGLDLRSMWDRKKSIIKQTGGLTVHTGVGSFDELGGLDHIKEYLRMIIAGKRPPKLVVLLDEIEKQVAGKYDSSGTGMDALGVLLSSMQDNGWGGALFPGVSGTGKTECGKAMGAEAGGLFLTLDMGGMRDKFVGNSEKMVRAAMSMLLAMGGENVFFIATCNSMEGIPPELKARFTYGTYFFDLPTEADRKLIWGIYRKMFRIDPKMQTPPDFGWTGREIKACCDRSDELAIPLIKAATKISPVYRSMGDNLKVLRESAHLKYLSAAKEGFYNMKEAETESAVAEIRAIRMED